MSLSETTDDSEYFETNIDEYDYQMDNQSDDEFYPQTLFDEYQDHLTDEEDQIPQESDHGHFSRWRDEEMADYDELED